MKCTENGELTTLTNFKTPDKDEAKECSYIRDGWWSSDENGKERITRANLGEKVFFNVEVKAKATGHSIIIALYDYDAQDGSDAILVFRKNNDGSEGDEVKTMELKDGKMVAHLPITLSPGLERLAELDTNDEIQLFFKCSYGDDLNISLPKNPDQYLEVHTCDKRVIKRYGNYGNCAYYQFRYSDFMQRHKDCIHVPPVYYYGPMLKMNKETKEFYEKKGLTSKMRAIGLSPEDIKMEHKQGYEAKPLLSYSYGYKYCIRFSYVLMPKLSAKGKEWLEGARKSLQILMDNGVVDMNYEAKYDKILEGMESTFNKNFEPSPAEIKKAGSKEKAKNLKIKKFYTNIELINKRFKSFAFATHPDAYNPKKMSELPAIDLAKVMLAPDFNEWRASETWLQAFIVAGNLDYNKLIMVNVDRYQKPQNSVLTDAWEVAQETGNKIKDELLDVLSYQNIQSFINQNDVLTND